MRSLETELPPQRRRRARLFGDWRRPETSAYLWDNAASGFVLATVTFFNLAILRTATVAAGCAGGPEDDDETCSRSTHGLKPASVLTLVAMLGQLSGACLTPFVGALSDYTDHRRFVGAGSAWIVAFITCAQAMLSQETWFFVALLQIFQVAAYVVHQATVLSYLPGLYRTDDRGLSTDEDVRNRVNACTVIIGFGAMLSGFIVIAAVLVVSGVGIINLSQIAQAGVGLVVTVIYAFVWHLNYEGAFPDVPALKQIPPRYSSAPQVRVAASGKKNNKAKSSRVGDDSSSSDSSSRGKAGATRRMVNGLGATLKRRRQIARRMFLLAARDTLDSYRLLRVDFPDVGLFLLGYSIANAGTSSFGTLAVVFLSEHLNLNDSQVVMVFFVNLVVAVPAGAASVWVMRPFGAQRTFIGAILVFMATTFIAYFVVVGSMARMLIFLLSVVWGACFGVFFAANTSFYTQLVPKHAESHFMAMYYFAGVILTWAPPAVFTTLNQLTNATRVVFFLIAAFFCLSLPFFLSVDVDRALKAIATHDRRLQLGSDDAVVSDDDDDARRDQKQEPDVEDPLTFVASDDRPSFSAKNKVLAASLPDLPPVVWSNLDIIVADDNSPGR